MPLLKNQYNSCSNKINKSSLATRNRKGSRLQFCWNALHDGPVQTRLKPNKICCVPNQHHPNQSIKKQKLFSTNKQHHIKSTSPNQPTSPKSTCFFCVSHHSSTTTRHVVLTRWVANDELPAPSLGDGETARHLGSWTDALIDRIDRIDWKKIGQIEKIG